MRSLGLIYLTFGVGCMMSGNYHTAKTLNKGESQFGMTFSGTQYQKTTTDSMGNKSFDAVVLPNIIPEFTYHIGMADNLEVGGRVSIGALGMEGDVKYRFLRNDKLHLAVAPAIGAQAFVVIEGVYVRVPLIMTYELADNFDFTAAVFGASAHYTPADSGSSDFDSFNGTLVSSGGAIGVDLHGETFSIRPAVEFTRYLYNFSASGSSTSDHFNTVNVLVHLAWTGGKEKQQLDRIEQKIDRLSAPPPSEPIYNGPPTAPPPGPPPGPAPGPDGPP
jgi:hypothetical protein